MNITLNCCYCNKPYERDGFLKRHQAICKANNSTNPLSTADMMIIVRDLLKRVDRLETDNSRLKARLASKRTNPCEWLKHNVRADTYFVPDSVTVTVQQSDVIKAVSGDLTQCIKDILERQSWDCLKCTNIENMKLYCFEEQGWRAIQATDLQSIAQRTLRSIKRAFDEYAAGHTDMSEDRYLDYTEILYKIKVDRVGTIIKKVLCSMCFISTDIV
jgi:hypothetical protein